MIFTTEDIVQKSSGKDLSLAEQKKRGGDCPPGVGKQIIKASTHLVILVCLLWTL